MDGFNLLQDSVWELIKSFQDYKLIWQVRIEARRALLDIEFYYKGIDAALVLFMKFLEEESSLRGYHSISFETVYANVLCFKCDSFAIKTFLLK